jgi:deazaflavin-dependent oxidoreductase (nitroreductase family)
MRAPIWLYRARLGALLGPRVILLEHLGRKTGVRRFAVLEVVDRPAPDRIVVASGFGERAQWFRNVAATPAVRVTRGSRRPARAVARVLPEDEARTVMRRYADRHPRAWERFRPILDDTLGTPIDLDGTLPPLVALDLTGPS